MLNKLWKNSKSQAPNKPLQGLRGRGQSPRKQIQISKFKTNAWQKVCFEHWDFGIWDCLVFGIWSLGFISSPDIEQLQRT